MWLKSGDVVILSPSHKNEAMKQSIYLAVWKSWNMFPYERSQWCVGIQAQEYSGHNSLIWLILSMTAGPTLNRWFCRCTSSTRKRALLLLLLRIASATPAACVRRDMSTCLERTSTRPKHNCSWTSHLVGSNPRTSGGKGTDLQLPIPCDRLCVKMSKMRKVLPLLLTFSFTKLD